MNYGLLVLGELERRIEGHRQLMPKNGTDWARNAVIVALVDVKNWLEKIIEDDLADFEKMCTEREKKKKLEEKN